MFTTCFRHCLRKFRLCSSHFVCSGKSTLTVRNCSSTLGNNLKCSLGVSISRYFRSERRIKIVSHFYTPKRALLFEINPQFSEENAEGERDMSCEESYLAIIRYLTDERAPYAPGTPGNTKRKIRKAAACYVVRNGTLFYQRRLKGQNDFTELEVVLQDSRRKELINEAHIIIEGGEHINQQLTWETISQKYWWRGNVQILTPGHLCEVYAVTMN